MNMKIIWISLLLGLLSTFSGCASNETTKSIAYDKANLEVWSGKVIDATAHQGSQVGSVILSPTQLVTPTESLTLLAKTINAELPRSTTESNVYSRVVCIFLDEPRRLPKSGDSCRIECTTEIDGAKWLRNVTILE